MAGASVTIKVIVVLGIIMVCGSEWLVYFLHYQDLAIAMGRSLAGGGIHAEE
jgi:ABC-type phosphate transport system auxiliary subunit